MSPPINEESVIIGHFGNPFLLRRPPRSRMRLAIHRPLAPGTSARPPHVRRRASPTGFGPNGSHSRPFCILPRRTSSHCWRLSKRYKTARSTAECYAVSARLTSRAERRTNVKEGTRVDDPPEHDRLEGHLERRRNDPRVIVRRQSTAKPFIPKIHVLGHVDVLDLLDRCRDEAEPDDDQRP